MRPLVSQIHKVTSRSLKRRSHHAAGHFQDEVAGHNGNKGGYYVSGQNDGRQSNDDEAVGTDGED